MGARLLSQTQWTFSHLGLRLSCLWSPKALTGRGRVQRCLTANCVACGKVMEGNAKKDGGMESVDRRREIHSASSDSPGPGFKKSFVVAVHRDVSADFEEYCYVNHGPMPRLFTSRPGQFDVPTFPSGSDVRTALPEFHVFVNGKCTETVPNLLQFENQLGDYSFFYLGCGCSSDEALSSRGVPLRRKEQGKAITPMYKSTIPCQPCGPFQANQVLAVKPIPRDLVERAVQITHLLTDFHGAPIHIGYPAAVGVDVAKADFGEPLEFQEGDVPVFWPRAMTSVETLKNAELPLAFSHKPAWTKLPDSSLDRPTPQPTPPPEDLPRVVWLADTPPLASVLSQAAVDKISALEECAVEDIGKRQIGNLLVMGDMLKSALSLSHAKSVAITTGFPVKLEGDNLFETDGPPGAVAMATVMQALGKNVVLVVDDDGGLVPLMKTLIEMLLERGVLSQTIPIECYPPKGEPATAANAKAFLTSTDGLAPRFDHLVAIERAGRAADGGYHSANGSDKSSKIGGVDELFQAAKDMTGVFTTGIGDGGNEIGMGKVFDRVTAHIPHGAAIGCTTATDYLICAGVSNWGGYALATALALLRLCPIHDRYRRRGVGLPPSQEESAKILAASVTVEKEEKMLEALVELGFMDATGEVKMAVDWLPFHDVHANKITEIIKVLH